MGKNLNAAEFSKKTHHCEARLDHYVICRHCDSIYEYCELPKGQQAHCKQCNTLLYRSPLDAQSAFIFTLTACLLFVGTHLFPLVTLRFPDTATTIHVFSTVRILVDNKMYVLACFVFFTIVLSPAFYLGLILWSIFSLHFKIATRATKNILHFISHLPPWNMLEIYMLGILVSLVKLSSFGEIEFNAGFWLFCCLIFFAIFTSSQFSLQRLLSNELDHT